MKIEQLPEPVHLNGFYPTPPDFASVILTGIDWDRIQYILEPSAGKGDLVKAILEKQELNRYSRYNERDVDCIEIDPILRASLLGQGYRVVHDDFLTFQTQTQYDLIVMNPPFKEGCAHLLKALELVRPGGAVLCILNAETIRNPYTNERTRLVAELERMEAKIEYHEKVFEDAERPTLVEVAVVKAIAPEQAGESIILEHLRKAHVDPWDDGDPNCEELIRGDLGAIIDLYNFQSIAGKKFLEDYKRMERYFHNSVGEYARPIIEVKIDGSDYWNVNDFLRHLRMKFWRALFSREAFIAKLTSNIQDDLHGRLKEFGHYEFSWFNIQQLEQELSEKVIDGIQQTILRQFEAWSRHALYDGSKNVHYYNGWKSNQAHRIAQKIILPFYHGVWDSWCGRNSFKPSDYRVSKELSDIEKVFDYLNGRLPDANMVHYRLQCAEKSGQSRKVQFRYFHVSFFKKGTIHIVFTDLDALYRFNMYAGRNLQWLPPTYGAKHYGDMDEEERTVIDAFEGAESYERMMERVDEYMRQERLGLPMPVNDEEPGAAAEDDDPFAEDAEGQMLLFA